MECPGLTAAANAWYSVLEPTAAYRGALLFFSGGGGNFYWSAEKRGAALLIDALRGDGFRILQLRWGRAWQDAEPGEEAGAAVGCRPATMTRYLHDTEYADSASPAGVCGYCIAGPSGGSAQAVYPLSHYGLAPILDGVFPISGPTHAAVAKGCQPDRVFEPYRYAGASTRRIDGPLGYVATTGPYAESNGPCRTNSSDPSWIPKWRAMSVDTGGSDYSYPATRVHVLTGQMDKILRAHGADFVRRLAEGGPLPGHQDASPWVTFELVPRMGHGITEFTDGTPFAEATLLKDFPGLVRLRTALLLADPSAFPACNNGRDDDGDGVADFGGVADPDPTVSGEPGLDADGGCAHAADPSEEHDATLPGSVACDDGLDNDGDGRFDATVDDFGDPGCESPLDPDERSLPGSGNDCDDGVDNDGDGHIDFPADPDCASPATSSEGAASGPAVSISDASIFEGNGGTRRLTFLITLSTPSSSGVMVSFATRDGTATAPSDYAARSGSVSFKPGSTSKKLHVHVNGDTSIESDESLFVDLFDPVGATLADATGEGQIRNDDGPTDSRAAAYRRAA